MQVVYGTYYYNLKKYRMKRRLIKSGAAVITLVVLFVAFGFNRDDKSFSIVKQLDIYYSLFRELNLFYVDEVDSEKLIKTSIDKMLASLDPYTTYIPESDMSDFNFMTTGEYGGMGSLIRKHGESVIVAEPYEGLPADRAGLRAGDIFLKIDDVETDSLEVTDVSNLLKGKAGTDMELLMQRPGEKKPYKVEITREKIHINAVTYSGIVGDNVGYISLSSFTMNCSKDVKRAVLELKEQGAESLILDLRSNPGGILQEAVKIVNIFVPQGLEVVNTKGRVSQWDHSYVTAEQPIDTITPLVVLVNSGSASASEIVSGAIQDLDRGVIVGNRTFGKGLVQTTRDLSYNSKLKVTTAKYYIPSGRCIQALDYSNRNKDGSVGVIPDSLVSTFYTRSGREVKDGGGVMPDLTVVRDTFSTLIFKLVNESMVFDFVTKEVNSTKTALPIEEFKAGDDIYNRFVEYLKEREFSYESRSETDLKRLIKLAKHEKYYNVSKEYFDELERSLAPDLERDLMRFKTEILDYMEGELATRLYYQKGAIKVALRDDDYLDRAYEVFLKDYKTILQGKEME